MYNKKAKLINPPFDCAKSLFEFRLRSIKGEVINLEHYKGSVCIVSSIASNSPYTDFNYKCFNELHDKYFEYGLRIMGFPCKHFKYEELGDEVAIMKVAAQYKVKWEIFEISELSGPNACELLKFVMAKVPDDHGHLLVKSNFTKFIVNRLGVPVARLPPEADVETMEIALFDVVDGFMKDVEEGRVKCSCPCPCLTEKKKLINEIERKKNELEKAKQRETDKRVSIQNKPRMSRY